MMVAMLERLPERARTPAEARISAAIPAGVPQAGAAAVGGTASAARQQPASAQRRVALGETAG